MRRVIMDLSFPGGAGVNVGVPKGEYLGEPTDFRLPTEDDLSDLINHFGPGCLLYKRDLSRAFRQLVCDPGDLDKFGYVCNGMIYIDRVLAMGLRSACYSCQMLTDAIMYIFRKRVHRG